MGLFSSKSTTYVSSVLYNMAGDESKRPNFLKTTVVGSVIAENGTSMGENIVRGYLNGPGIKLRNYANWATSSGYANAVGQVSGTLGSNANLDDGVVTSQIPDDGLTVFLQSAKTGNADYEYWVDKHVLDNYPDKLLEEYTADYSQSTNEISIFFIGSTVTFTPIDYSPYSRYIYAAYMLGEGEAGNAVVEGSTTTLATNESFPSVADWENKYNNVTNQSVSLTTTVTTINSYSDGRANDTTVTSSTTVEDYNMVNALWEKIDYQGNLKSTKKLMYRWVAGSKVVVTSSNTTTSTISGGVTKTSVATQNKDTFSVVRTYRLDTQEITNSSLSNIKLFIYKEGNGNALLDSQFVSVADVGTFLPYIPLRIENKFLSTTIYPSTYAVAKKAFKKATQSSMDTVLDSIGNNESIGDIDFAYAVFGVSLNVKENACKKYIYNFFDSVLDDANLTNSLDYAQWKANWATANASVVAWAAWRDGQYNSNSPYYGVPEPTQIPYPMMPTNRIAISSAANSAMNYSMAITWNFIAKTTGSGLAKANAKVGSLWFENGADETFNESTWYTNNRDSGGFFIRTRIQKVESIALTWQVSATEWAKLTLAGLRHRNFVYQGKSVDISAKEALADADESGFIIPLHEGIYRSMGLKDGTQMSTACSFIVFNCYQVVKRKWYQSGIFQIILIIAVIIISIYYPPAAGLLGTSGAVGGALGLSGTMAVIAGAAVNAIASMLLMRIIQAGVTKLIGGKYAVIISAIIAVIAVTIGTGMLNGASFATSVSSLANPANLLKLTMAAGNGYAGYLQNEAMSIAAETAKVYEEYNIDAKEISQKYLEEFGLEGGVFDPTKLTDAVGVLDQSFESVNSFLGRTLMTGSEIAELSMSFIEQFAALTTSVELP